MRLDGWTSIRSEIFDSTIRQTILHLANISLLMQFGKGRVNLCIPNLITCLLPSEANSLAWLSPRFRPLTCDRWVWCAIIQLWYARSCRNFLCLFVLRFLNSSGRRNLIFPAGYYAACVGGIHLKNEPKQPPWLIGVESIDHMGFLVQSQLSIYRCLWAVA